jgi:transposase InsO family protein
MLMIEIGTPKRRAAIAVTRSNEPSAGVSRISYRFTAAMRSASFVGTIVARNSKGYLLSAGKEDEGGFAIGMLRRADRKECLTWKLSQKLPGPKRFQQSRWNETWRWTSCTTSWRQVEKLRVLTIVDTFSRFSPALEPGFSFRRTDCECTRKSRPASVIPGNDPGRSDTDFVSRWAYEHGVTLDFSRPGKYR